MYLLPFLILCDCIIDIVQVEGAPAVLRKGVKKEEAEQIKEKLEAAGAKIVLDWMVLSV